MEPKYPLHGEPEERKQRFARAFMEKPTKDCSTKFAAKDTKEPFHYRIDDYILHVEPAYERVADITIEWTNPTTVTLLNTLSNTTHASQSDQASYRLRHGIFMLALVPAIDTPGDKLAIDIPENRWEFGYQGRCGTCVQWRRFMDWLKSPGKEETSELLSLGQRGSDSGFYFRPEGQQGIPWAGYVRG
ncbi:hypothetical protein F5X96DRAFT_663179 [Biscogniauxia mediterranea]|nr:hypothetical protein F5X96DRAFT_663179 [Biscogniauxia mediterranea]